MIGPAKPPVEQLPEPLPAGERVLWQGRPTWWGLAARAFHVRKVAIYCALLLVWHGGSLLAEGMTVAAMANALLLPTGLTLGLLAILSGLAWLYARTTGYVVTDRRVVMHYGVAVPMTVNLPLRTIASLGLKTDRQGTGDLPMALLGGDRIAWLALWPHVRPWRLRRPEPMLRGLAEAERVARLLADAIARTPVAPRREPTGEAAPEPAGDRSVASAA